MEKIIRTFLVFLLSVYSWSAQSDEQGRLAIIIDDVGYQKSNFELLNLPSAITFSLLPDTPYGKAIAEQAYGQHRPLMLHIPMQAYGMDPKPGTLSLAMGEVEFNSRVNSMLDDFPWVSGVNNHMGSALTSAPEPMHWLMKNLSQKHLFFIDSRTSSKTVAESIAKGYPIKYQHRHVFLDHEVSLEFIEQQLELAMELTHKQKGVIAIGHPYDLTISMLKEKLPELLESYNVKLVKTSELLLTGSEPQAPLIFPLHAHLSDHKSTHKEQSPDKPEAAQLDQINDIDFLY